MKRVYKSREVLPPATKTALVGRDVDCQEIPVFVTDQARELSAFLEGKPYTPKETIVRLVRCGFSKDGVWVDPASDPCNADVKRTACGCLYWFKRDDLRWPYDCEPSDIVWHKAPADWSERQENDDWTTLETNKPEKAPWLAGDEKEDAA